MQVSLKVVGGKNDGREIAISVSRFIIGRAETAHLRPASDLVSREHCAIEVKEGQVLISDLKSRNGTFVNGKQITEPHLARSGDSVRVGRLQFEMLIDPVKASAKKPKVNDVVEAAARTVTAKRASLEDSITDWLLEGNDDDDQPSTQERQKLADADTIQLTLDDTTAISGTKSANSGASAHEKEASDATDDSSAEGTSESVKDNKKKKPQPMKLPPMKQTMHENSTTAADDVLRKFFNRR